MNPREVPRQWVITIQTGPVWQGTDRRWIPLNEQEREGSGKCHLPRWPYCSPLPNLSLCDQTLGPLAPYWNLIKNTIPLLSTSLCGASTPIRIPNILNIEPHIPRWISINNYWLAPLPHQNEAPKMDLKTPTLGDTGGRTAQALLKETLVAGQIRRQKNYN